MAKFSADKKHVKDIQRIETLLEIEKGLKDTPFPRQIVVESTSICNMTCIHCSHKELEREKRHMDRGLWEKIVDEIGRKSPECEVWPTFYGEAMIMSYKNELWDRLDYADKVGCKNLVLNSNGMLLDRWDSIDKILASPLKRFILSLDGFSKETFEKIRVKGKWDEVYPNVEELCRRRLERGQTYPAITAQFSVMPDNIDEVEDYTAFWRARGAEVKVRPMLEWTRSGSIRTDTIDTTTDFRIACPWGINTMAIHQDGSVVACAVDYSGKVNIGNIKDISLKEAWERLGEHLRKPHLEHDWDNIPEICKGCGDWQVAGAEYEPEIVEGTRPFWYYENQKEKKATEQG